MLRSVAETAVLLGGVHEQTVRKLIKTGELASVRIGTRILVDDADIDAYIDAHRNIASCG